MDDEDAKRQQRDELLAFIRAEGKYSYLGGGITTFPNDADGKHEVLLDLEKSGYVVRHFVSDTGSITWKARAVDGGY